MRKFINQRDMRRANAADVLALVRDRPGITRKELERATGFSWGAVSGLCARLLEGGYLTEEKADPTGAGRTPCRLFVNKDRLFVPGIDVNRAGLSAVLLNLQNETAATAFRDVTGGDPLAEAERFIGELVRRYTAEGRALFAVGIAMQGGLDTNFAETLSGRIGLPVYTAHDPDCILYAYTRGLPAEDAMLLRADSGIGMAVTADGVPVSRPGALEIGHTCVARGGPRCVCGKRGCLECYASMRGLEARSGLPFGELERRAENGDARALRLFRRAAGLLGGAAGNAAILFDVRKILLYGELWNAAGGLIYREFCRVLNRTVQAPTETAVLPTGGAAAGAAMLAARRELENVQIE